MRKGIILTLLISLFTIWSTDAYALFHYFKNGKKAEESGNYDKALSYYNRVLERHPYETKSLLRAYDHILNIHKKRNNSEETKDVLAQLKDKFPDRSFDLRDFEKLSLIYSKYGEEAEALGLQRKIIDVPYSPLYIDTVLRTYSRLLKTYRDKKDAFYFSETINRLASLPTDDFSETDNFEYAMILLKYGKRDEALRILDIVITEKPNTLSSRRALFILAEEAQKAKNYDAAIKYYSLYIERYEQNTFYVQKAYQRMIDSYILKGDGRFTEDLIKQAADLVNGVSDYRSRLNFAIDLKSKNIDSLAEATFAAGYNGAEKIIAGNPGTYDALKAHLEIQRAAHAFGRFDLVEKSALATLKDFGGLKGNSEFNRNVDFVKSQAYLWLAKIYSERQKHDDTIKMLEEFRSLYPDHKDIDYALFELGRSYEKKGLVEKAKELYMLVGAEPMKNIARERLSKLK